MTTLPPFLARAALPLCLLAACGGSAGDPDLVLGKLELAYAEIEQTLKDIHDLAGARGGVARIQAAAERLDRQRRALAAIDKASFSDEQRKRVEALAAKVPAIMVAMIALPPDVRAYVQKEIGDIDFRPDAK